jgi:hypothetical protein
VAGEVVRHSLEPTAGRTPQAGIRLRPAGHGRVGAHAHQRVRIPARSQDRQGGLQSRARFRSVQLEAARGLRGEARDLLAIARRERAEGCDE